MLGAEHIDAGSRTHLKARFWTLDFGAVLKKGSDAMSCVLLASLFLDRTGDQTGTPGHTR